MSLNVKEVKEKSPQKDSLTNSSEQHAKFIEISDRERQPRRRGSSLPPRAGSSLGMFLSLYLKNDCDGVCSLSRLPADVSGTENSLVIPTFPGIC